MKGAMESRGFLFQDKAISAAEDARGDSSEEVAAQRLKVDTYKWAAEVNNPEVFGKKTKIEGTTAPTVIVIETGIRREEQPAIEVKATEVPPSDALPIPEPAPGGDTQ